MDTTALKSLQRFKTPESWFSAVDARHAAALFAASSDVSLIIDGKGVIQDIALGNEDYYPLDLETWVGKSLHDIVNIDSRSKAAALLRDATFDARTRWREVNVVIPSGSSIPLNFTAVRLSADGDVVLFGRDLATEARLQQRVIDIQREMNWASVWMAADLSSAALMPPQLECPMITRCLQRRFKMANSMAELTP